MFWNRKEVVKVAKVDGLPITLSKRQAFNPFTGDITTHFLAYKSGNEWRGLVGYEQFKKEMDETRKRQELILDHLKLKYVPETETKEPAKLVEKTNYLTSESGHFASSSNRNEALDLMVLETLLKGVAVPKKKRGRPKKK